MTVVRDLPVSGWPDRWPTLRLDEFQHIDDMLLETMDAVERMVAWAYVTYRYLHRINSDFRPTDKKQHGQGRAVDLVMYRKSPGDVPYMVQFLVACRFPFTGLGFYPHWNAPGIHVDIRELAAGDPRAMWWQDSKNVYRSMDVLP